MMQNDETERILSRLVAGVLGGSASAPATQRSLDQLLLSSIDGSSGTSPGLVTGRTQAEPALDGAMAQLSRQLAELATISRSQADTVEANTKAVIENSLRQSGGNKESTVGSIGRTILSFLGGGLGIVQLFGKLFGDGKAEALPTLAPYNLPPSLQLSAGLTPLGIQPIHYGQNGLPRSADGPGSLPGQPITIQVQAIDSRSFLDHSSEIAQAVKEALLHSHSLNDVVSEL